MHRILNNARRTSARVGLITLVVTVTVVAFALPAGANTGFVTTSQTCYEWSASVSLNTNVSSDHFVEVSSTIPGTTGIVDAHFKTTQLSQPLQIWEASGPAPSSGTVTLTILNSDRSLDFTQSASLPASSYCATTTTATTTTMAPPVTQAIPTTTTAAATTTSIEVSATTATSSSTTTSIEVSPTTVKSTSTTRPATVSTVVPQGSTIPTTTTSIAPAAATETLPFTGSGAVFPAIFGLSCLTGGGMLALRRRRRWVVRR